MSYPYSDEKLVRELVKTITRDVDGKQYDFPVRIEVVHPIYNGRELPAFYAYTSFATEDFMDYDHHVEGAGGTEEKAIMSSTGAFLIVDARFRKWLEKHKTD
jgi:hypothetical protein